MNAAAVPMRTNQTKYGTERSYTLEGGKDYKEAIFYLDEPIRTGVLFYKSVSSFKPNYYVDYLEDSPWIHMPYEVYETMKPEELG